MANKPSGKLALLSWLFSSLLVGAGTLQPRQLEWRALDVAARLDEDGRLHVAERHAMVLTGDWNGGERRFRLGFGQELKFKTLSRIDPVSNTERALSEGDLSRVDHFAWHDSTTLRWRSRRPDEPPFNRTELTYLLEYTLSNILVVDGNGFLLDHDFAFPDRPGLIRNFSLELEIDPAWRQLVAVSKPLKKRSLFPGQSVVVAVPLEYHGRSRPAGVRLGPPISTRYALVMILLAALTIAYSRFYRREKSLGRFDPLLPAGSIDEQWLQQNCFTLPPEVAGAAWDDTTAAPEVAAVLARLVAEGKIRTEIEKRGFWLFRKEVLHMHLLVERKNFNPYERRLVDSFFFAGRDSTDSDSIRQRYSGSGFDPASKIKEALGSLVKKLVRVERQASLPSRRFAVAVLALGVVLLVLAALMNREEAAIAGTATGLAIFFYAASAGLAALSRKRVELVRLRSLQWLIPILAYLVAAIVLIGMNPFQLSLFLLSGIALLGFGAFLDVLRTAMCRDGREKIALKKKLASARRYFARQLKLAKPQLKDEWLPYLIAFGLGPGVDRWFRAHGAFSRGGSHSEYESSGSSAGGWTGGGGKFGGGGATGSWTAAVGQIASGVSDSSSDGGSGGGGGGSSGGGGGGGW